MPMHAQENDMRLILSEAEEAYQIGKVEDAKRLLENNIQNLNNNLRLRGYRLLSLCCLALDQSQEARVYAERMLNEDPYYSPTVDYPPRFIDMVNAIKQSFSITTITTASSQAESLGEVPVPTTLITEEMIHNCGATNLQEVLAAYVPGMHLIDCNDDINIAMRGIYSNGQEKILVMLNGHRLNSYATNIAAPDFSISLEKIRQIEVLRGPASSIYGGVALTAVVNLITKQGADVDGVKVKAGIGNYGQLRGDLLFGKRYYDLDLLVWGSIYKNKGERQGTEVCNNDYPLFGDSITVGRIGNKPSYNFGLQLNWKHLQFLYDSHFSQIVAPFVMSTMASPYQHDKYRTYNGIFPSFATNTHHIDLAYSQQFGRLTLNGALTYDQNVFTHYQAIFDYPMRILAYIYPTTSGYEYIFADYGGLSRYINGHELDYGARLKADFSYIDNSQHKGSIVYGAEMNRFKLEEFCYQYGYYYTETMPEDTRLREIGKGHEVSANTFLQLKHKWRSLILNAGLRYDYKRRSNDTRLDEISPRIALILSRPKWNMKLSYSKSFVDAPYLYRTLNAFDEILTDEDATPDLGDDDPEFGLSPERVHSWQFAFAGIEWFKGFNFEVNAFYNHAKELIVTNIYEYENGGTNKTAGVELMATYRSRKFTANVNLSWIHTFRNNLMILDDDFPSEFSFDANINANNNTPGIMSNAVLSWQVSKPLKLFTHLLFEGKQTSYNLNMLELVNLQYVMEQASVYEKNGMTEEYLAYYADAVELTKKLKTCDEMPARLICNVGAEYQFGKHLTLGLNVRNLFNTQYNRSGMNTRLIPQRGRWWMASVAWQF